MHNNVKELGHHWFQARACYVKMIELLPISLLRTNFNEIWIKLQQLS